MAINKKLIHFKSKENFEKEVANENILDTSICFILDSKEISTHGTVYKTVNWSILEELIVPGYLCYKINEEYKFINPNKYDSSLRQYFKGIIMSINNDNTFTIFYPTYSNTYNIELRETLEFESLSNSPYWDENTILIVINNIGSEKLKSILSKLEVSFLFPIFTDLRVNKGSAVGCTCIYEDGSTDFKWSVSSLGLEGTVLKWNIENINYVK